MNVALRARMTVAEFLVWEDRQELRYEFDGVRPIAMTGGTYAHDALQMALARVLGNRLRGKPCRAHGSNLKIAVMGSIRYPDAYVSCAPIARTSKLVTEPVVIFEVISPSTAATDRTVKNREYAGTASVRRYVMLEQTEIGGTMFERVGDDWIGHLLSADTVLQMPEIGIELPIAELYEDLDLSAPLDDDTGEETA